MKKIKIAALAVVALMSAGMLCACGEETVKKVGYELPHYDGTARRDFDSEDKPYYNSELWRRNSSLNEGADFQVLDDTERTGYYYAILRGLIIFTPRTSKIGITGRASFPRKD